MLISNEHLSHFIVCKGLYKEAGEVILSIFTNENQLIQKKIMIPSN